MGPLAVDPDAAAARRLTRPRPGHADLAGGMKFGARDLRDVLERASARESAARVAAGAVCKLLLRACGIEVAQRRALARRRGRRGLAAILRDPREGPRRLAAARLRRARSSRRWSPRWTRRRRAARRSAARSWWAPRGVPAGLGCYASWDRKLDGRIGQALLSVPAVKAVEFGSAIEASRGPGSRGARRDRAGPDGALRRRTNRAGGLEAGVTNGEDLIAVVYMKPISTLARGLDSVDLETRRGRALRLRAQRRDRRAGLRRHRRGHARVRPRRRPARADRRRPPRGRRGARFRAHRERVARYPD